LKEVLTRLYKGKSVPVCNMSAYGGVSSVVPLILKLGIPKWGCVINFTLKPL